MTLQGRSIYQVLAEKDAYHALDLTGGLIKTGAAVFIRRYVSYKDIKPIMAALLLFAKK